MSTLSDKEKNKIMEKLESMDLNVNSLHQAMKDSKTLVELFQQVSAKIVEQELETGKSASKAKKVVEDAKAKATTQNTLKGRARKRGQYTPALSRSTRVRAELAYKKNLRDVYQRFKNIEAQHRVQHDERFLLTRDRRTGNSLRKTQDSIAEYRNQKNRFNIAKKRKEKGLFTPDLGEQLY